MSTDRKPDKREADGSDDLEREVDEAMTSLGWKVPQTEDEVLRAEAELAENPAPLPDELTDPAEVFDRAPGQTEAGTGPLLFPTDQDIEADLARAARDGGPIPPEIEEVLRRDREAAEREFDDGEEKA